MQYLPLAVGRDNGVTALRHDTPISVSRVEDEVMAGRARVSGERGGTVFAGEDRGSRARESKMEKMRRER